MCFNILNHSKRLLMWVICEDLMLYIHKLCKLLRGEIDCNWEIANLCDVFNMWSLSSDVTILTFFIVLTRDTLFSIFVSLSAFHISTQWSFLTFTLRNFSRALTARASTWVMQSIVVSALSQSISCSSCKTDFRCAHMVMLLNALSVVIAKSLFLILNVSRILTTWSVSVASVWDSLTCSNLNKAL